jgi:uncharacterized protein (DUF4415 family)
MDKAEFRRRMIEAGVDLSAEDDDNAPIDDPDNPELTDEDIERMVAVEDLPADLQAIILKAFPRTRLRGRQKAPKKIPVSIRLSPEVVEHFKAGGPGWQRRIDEALKRIAKG